MSNSNNIIKIGFAILLIMGLIIVLVSCIIPGYGTPITGSGVLKTQDMDYINFDRLIIGSAFNIEITRADSYSISITLDDNLFEYLQINQNSSTLSIKLAQNHSYIHTIQRATITLPALHKLELSGASQGKATGFSSSDELDINLSGASDLNVSSIKAGVLSFEISGASHVAGNITFEDGRFNISGASTAELDGSAKNIILDVSGASDARLSEFTVIDANIIISGASRATINATGKLDADVSGASRLTYLGSPTLGKVNSSGGSTISQK